MDDAQHGIVKRHEDHDFQRPFRDKGINHNMHRKDGMKPEHAEGKLVYSDLGTDWSKNTPASPGEKGRKSYPTIRVSGEHMGELADCKVGDEVEMAVKCKIASISQQDGRSPEYELRVEKAAKHEESQEGE